MAAYVLAIDQGTTSTRAILFHADTSVASFAQPRVSAAFSGRWRGRARARGFVVDGARDPPRSAMRNASASAKDIAAIGITNQRETTIVWHRNDRPARASRNRLAGPADCRSLRAAAGRRARGYVCSKDRPFARPLFLRHEGRLAAAERCGERGPCRARRTRVRNRRQLFAVASHRRQDSRHRRDERFAHVAVRHSSRAMG